jgi:hypothetical protein
MNALPDGRNRIQAKSNHMIDTRVPEFPTRASVTHSSLPRREKSRVTAGSIEGAYYSAGGRKKREVQCA